MTRHTIGPLLTFADATHRLSENEVLNLLALAVGSSTEDKLARIAAAYRSDPARRFFALLDHNEIVAVIGALLGEESSATILHLAVRADHQRMGLGRRLLEELGHRFHLRSSVAETDQEGVGFYERCGFRTDSLGNLHPGVERFVCRWEG